MNKELDALNKVCLLKKFLYGLKQASRQWHTKLLEVLTSREYRQSKNDYSLFIKKKKERITIIAIYVNDIIITGDDKFEIKTLKQYLDKTFTIKDLGKLHHFLGIEVSYNKKGNMSNTT